MSFVFFKWLEILETIYAETMQLPMHNYHISVCYGQHAHVTLIGDNENYWFIKPITISVSSSLNEKKRYFYFLPNTVQMLLNS